MLLILLNSLNDGERTKTEQIYHQYKYLMLKIALNILRNKNLAEEAIQDAMISIIKVINDIEEVNCHKTCGLVVTIIRNTSLNKLKYENRRKHGAAEVLDYLVTDEKSLDDILIDKVAFQDIVKEMKNIKNIDYLILILKYYYGYTYREIAPRVNMKEAAARKRCERAKKAILYKINSKEVDHEAKQ